MVTRGNFKYQPLFHYSYMYKDCESSKFFHQKFPLQTNIFIHSMTGLALIFQEDNETKFVKFSKIRLFHILSVLFFAHFTRLLRFLDLSQLIPSQSSQSIPCECKGSGLYHLCSIQLVLFSFPFCNLQFDFVKTNSIFTFVKLSSYFDSNARKLQA